MGCRSSSGFTDCSTAAGSLGSRCAALAGLFLLPPTLLMGATLPAIARHVETSREGVAWLGFFYGGNLVGAVMGCLAAGFYLLRLYDMPTATYAAAAINIGVAVVALLLARTSAYRGAEAAQAFGGESDTIPGAVPVYVAISLSGASAPGAEVIWTRLLSLLLGGTVYTFSIILAVFLVGLGIGSALGSLAGATRRRRARAGRLPAHAHRGHRLDRADDLAVAPLLADQPCTAA